MGRVYRVTDLLHPERRVALKVRASSLFDSARFGLFKAEFHTMSELAHPHIARVYDFESVAGTGQHIFTMELVEGRDLYAASANQPAAQIVDWIVEGLPSAALSAWGGGVVHADLKPSNILVTPSGAVKVLDFGLSGGLHAGLVLGTPAYMAPELATGNVDARVDLYALGILFYVAALPPCALHRRDLRRATRAARAPAAGLSGRRNGSQIPDGIRGVIERLCAKDPAARFTGSNEVVAALSRSHRG